MRKLWSNFKWLFKTGIKLILTGIAVFLLTNAWIIVGNENRLYDNIEDIPTNDVGLVLGTSKRLSGGYSNPYFTYRIKAAHQLYKAGKVKCLLVSGDNGHRSYNEPRDLQNALIKLGVPDSCIVLDYAGFRTLDSVVRSKEVFQQERITVISQRFHNYRAAFVGKYYGVDVVAFNAKSPRRWDYPIYREYLARPKAILDLYILRTKPKFLGKKEYICP